MSATWVSQSAPSLTRSIPSEISGRVSSRSSSEPRWRSYSCCICGASQLGAWMPLVMWPIGTSSSGRSLHKPRHMWRVTSPCSDDTALARPEARRPSTVMQNGSSASSGFTRPRLMSRSCETPRASRSGPRCSSIRSAGNRSCPAGTGVWVVKTVRRATCRVAVSKSTPSRSTHRRIASSTAKALCPSFRWNTPGTMPSACNALSPPMPSSSSCRMRTRTSPP